MSEESNQTDESITEFGFQFPESVQGLYVTPAPNEPIQLYSGELVLCQGERHMSGAGRILLKWLPSPPRTVFELEHVEGRVELTDAKLYVPDLSYECEASVTYTRLLRGPCQGQIGAQSRSADVRADHVVFHLPNFHSYLGSPIRNSEGTRTWRGRLTLRHDQWIITLDSVQDADSLRRQLRAEGGFALTNHGSIRASDGKPFALADALSILDALFYFLSFARGTWCGPALPVASERKKEVWRDIQVPRVREWNERRSWFPGNERDTEDDLSEAFSGLLRLWDKATWNEPLRIALHWYIEANTNAGGVEGGIVLGQAALELLGWVYLVEDAVSKTTSGLKFDRQSAEKRIEDLLGALRIPSRIPTELSALRSAAEILGAERGAEMLVKMRNAIVHPKRSRRRRLQSLGIPARIEALTMGLWFLEMVFLRLFGYRGVYYSRLKDGRPDQVRDAVPWK